MDDKNGVVKLPNGTLLGPRRERGDHWVREVLRPLTAAELDMLANGGVEVEVDTATGEVFSGMEDELRRLEGEVTTRKARRLPQHLRGDCVIELNGEKYTCSEMTIQKGQVGAVAMPDHAAMTKASEDLAKRALDIAQERDLLGLGRHEVTYASREDIAPGGLAHDQGFEPATEDAAPREKVRTATDDATEFPGRGLAEGIMSVQAVQAVDKYSPAVREPMDELAKNPHVAIDVLDLGAIRTVIRETLFEQTDIREARIDRLAEQMTQNVYGILQRKTGLKAVLSEALVAALSAPRAFALKEESQQNTDDYDGGYGPVGVVHKE